ncbi:hypothetical protein [Absidia glauca]|uniref:Uncharacterized protein n=1 Tax=Absidia glauca TaxID=4829 RepID=A0A168LUX0_ABSGL|nr:hypothetical protein [Absidia glauca]
MHILLWTHKTAAELAQIDDLITAELPSPASPLYKCFCSTLPILELRIYKTSFTFKIGPIAPDSNTSHITQGHFNFVGLDPGRRDVVTTAGGGYSSRNSPPAMPTKGPPPTASCAVKPLKMMPI